MTACTQPGCTGTIVDGYCDVCGSPVGAVPFVPAEAAAWAGSPASADGPGLTAVGWGAGGSSPDPKDEGLNTACTEPGCTGTIVDGYCDVCGSPAGAVPFVPAEAAASAGLPAPVDEPGLTAVPAPTPAPAPVDREIPTQRIPRAKLPRQRLSAQEMADPGADDRGDVEAEKVHGKKELAEDEPDGAEDYRARVEEAQLPDDVHKAALCEVGNLERTSDHSPESGEIRTWLDTILDLPWSTKTRDSNDIQGEREVDPAAADTEKADTQKVEPERADTEKVEPEKADTENVEPEKADTAAADPEKVDTAKVDPATADSEKVDTAKVDTEKADTAPAGPHDGDTVEVPAALAVRSGGGHPGAQLPEQQVLGPVLVQNPAEKRRSRSLVVAATALAALLIGAFLFGVSRDRGVTAQSVPTVTATATATVSMPTSEPPDESTHTGSTIQLGDLPDSARPFETIRIQGRYRGGADTFLRVQRSEGGKWLAFPVPTKTDQSGRFTAHVEFGQPGRYRLRVLDPDSGVTSKPFVLVIEA
jgi:hypothetical protein